MIRHPIVNPLLVLLVAGALVGAAALDGRSSPTSVKPAYAKLAISLDNSRILNLVLTSTDGTAYDTMYADTNFNGRFDSSEKMSGKVHRQGSAVAGVGFDALKLPVPRGTSGRNSREHSDVIHLWTSASTGSGAGKELRCHRILSFRNGRAYTLQGQVKTAKTLRAAPIVKFGKKPEVTLDVRADKDKPGNTGIAVWLKHGQWDVFGARMPTTIVISDKDGRQIQKASGDMYKFCYG